MDSPIDQSTSPFLVSPSWWGPNVFVRGCGCGCGCRRVERAFQEEEAFLRASQLRSRCFTILLPLPSPLSQMVKADPSRFRLSFRRFAVSAALLSFLVVYNWQRADPLSSRTATTDPVFASSEDGMYSLTRHGLEAAAGKAHLKQMVGVGLRQEFAPLWPMPLPEPFPRNKNKHTLVLDIDETLIHTYDFTKHMVGSMEKSDAERELASSVALVDYSMLVRPHLKEFLTEVSELFEVVYWTAGTASYCAAVLDAIERQVLDKEPSFYNYLELAKGRRGEQSTANANFYALSRTQTLESKQYMKYMPLLGRHLKNVLMIDDNVRSFPLTPRNGIKVPSFEMDDQLLNLFLRAASEVEKAGGKTDHLDKRLLTVLDAGGRELQRLEQDTALLDVLPMLRAVAKTPPGGDVTRELDHWRDLDYVKCDDFRETMNPRSVVRRSILGSWVAARNKEPIAPLKNHHMNVAFLEEVNSEVRFTQMRSKERSKL